MADQTPSPTSYEHRGDMTTSGFVPTAPVTQHITNLVPGTKYSVKSSATYKHTEDEAKLNERNVSCAAEVSINSDLSMLNVHVTLFSAKSPIQSLVMYYMYCCWC